jgi:cobalt/nickel transport system ATP-binding protein
MEKIVTIMNIDFQYENENIFSDFTLGIDKGDKVGLIGPNGSGKTTLFLLLTGVYKPSSGEIVFKGQPIKYGKFNEGIGMVFQKPDDQLFCPTVWEDIAFGPQNMGLGKSEVRNRVDYAISLMDISKIADKPPHHLSGGEKCLTTIAGIVAMKSDFILFDEPTANLDLKYRRRLIDFINSSGLQGCMVASHDLEFVLEVCNRVCLLSEGKIAAYGNPKKIMSNRELMEANHLEVPYSLK